MSNERKAVSATNFKQRVGALVRSGKSIRANAQECIQYAVLSYLNPENNGNTNDMSYLYQQVASVKSLNHKLMGQYIEDTVNVKLAKTSEGEFVFRKAVKGAVPAFTDNGDIDANWWEHGRPIEPKPVDLVKLLETAIKAIQQTEGDTPKRALKEGQECVATDLLGRLSDTKTWMENAISIRNAAAQAESGDVIQDIAA